MNRKDNFDYKKKQEEGNAETYFLFLMNFINKHIQKKTTTKGSGNSGIYQECHRKKLTVSRPLPFAPTCDSKKKFPNLSSGEKREKKICLFVVSPLHLSIDCDQNIYVQQPRDLRQIRSHQDNMHIYIYIYP